MDEPLRILHFADLHLGVAGYGPVNPQSGVGGRAQDFLQLLDELVALAREQEVDLTVFAGDAFHSRAPNPTLQREFALRVQAFAELAPLLLLPGRHDLPPHPRRASSLDIFATLAVSGVHVANDYEVLQLETKRGPLAVATAPWPQRARLLPDSSGAMDEAALAAALTARLEQLAAAADGFGMPRLLVGHLAVSGAKSGSEANYMPGATPTVPLADLADSRWDYVALGHHHIHQNLTEARADCPPVVYSGGLERIDFSEEDEPRGACLVQLARNTTTWRFLPLPARPLRTLRLDLRDSPAPDEALQSLIEGQALEHVILRLQLQLSAENEAALNVSTLRETLRRAGVWHLASLQRLVDRPAQVAAGSVEGLDVLQLLERYLQAQELAPDRQAELLIAASDLLRDEAVTSGPD